MLNCQSMTPQTNEPSPSSQVKATYKYDAEDEDELSFEPGEIIYVINYEYPEEEQEDGWLMGYKASDGQKGLFPMNFTAPVWPGAFEWTKWFNGFI